MKIMQLHLSIFNQVYSFNLNLNININFINFNIIYYIYIGGLIKAFFKSETLSDIHQSLNSIDKLRILIAKAYKNLHPYGQGILGVLHAAKSNHPEIKNYIHRIGKFNFKFYYEFFIYLIKIFN